VNNPPGASQAEHRGNRHPKPISASRFRATQSAIVAIRSCSVSSTTGVLASIRLALESPRRFGVLRLAPFFREECENLVEQLQVNFAIRRQRCRSPNRPHAQRAPAVLLGAKTCIHRIGIETGRTESTNQRSDRAAELLQSVAKRNRGLSPRDRMLTHDPSEIPFPARMRLIKIDAQGSLRPPSHRDPFRALLIHASR